MTRNTIIVKIYSIATVIVRDSHKMKCDVFLVYFILFWIVSLHKISCERMSQYVSDRALITAQLGRRWDCWLINIAVMALHNHAAKYYFCIWDMNDWLNMLSERSIWLMLMCIIHSRVQCTFNKNAKIWLLFQMPPKVICGWPITKFLWPKHAQTLH